MRQNRIEARRKARTRTDDRPQFRGGRREGKGREEEPMGGEVMRTRPSYQLDKVSAGKDTALVGKIAREREGAEERAQRSGGREATNGTE